MSVSKNREAELYVEQLKTFILFECFALSSLVNIVYDMGEIIDVKEGKLIRARMETRVNVATKVSLLSLSSLEKQTQYVTLGRRSTAAKKNLDQLSVLM